MARKYKGYEVISSARRLRIEVTAKDIDNGTPLDPENCAAAECIKRTLGASDVAVHRGVVYIQRKAEGKYMKYRTTSSLRMETIIYDRGGRFMAGEYDLREVPVNEIVKKKKSPSQPRTQAEMHMATRRRVIPGVRRTARSTTSEGE